MNIILFRLKLYCSVLTDDFFSVIWIHSVSFKCTGKLLCQILQFWLNIYSLFGNIWFNNTEVTIIINILYELLTVFGSSSRKKGDIPLNIEFTICIDITGMSYTNGNNIFWSTCYIYSLNNLNEFFYLTSRNKSKIYILACHIIGLSNGAECDICNSLMYAR